MTYESPAPDAVASGSAVNAVRRQESKEAMTLTHGGNDAELGAKLKELIELRRKLLTAPSELTEPYTGPVLPEALDALKLIDKRMGDAELNKYCDTQLQLNSLAYDSYLLRNRVQEEQETRSDGTDFFAVAKVDSHLHMSAMFTTPELFEYIRELYDKDAGRVLSCGKTVGQVIENAGFLPGKSAMDDMRTLSTTEMFRDFAKFNCAFSPFRDGSLRDLLMKPTEFDGEYFKEFLLRNATKAQKSNVYLEPRITIKGAAYGEWEELAKWVARVKPTHKHLLWAVQLPRVYQFRHGKKVKNFGEFVLNFFGPMFQATLHPDKHPELAAFLKMVGMIDTVDNEDVYDEYDVSDLPAARDYAVAENPPYAYYHFYWWYNMRALNTLRASKGLNVLHLRPHAGEAGAVHHLATAFLFADGISHGINLSKQPLLQYLYYLDQVGISVSPISNKCLFIPYMENPFPLFFRRGLRVTLSTDDPLQFHMSATPLVEEYTTARHVWQLSMTDLSEIALNSVILSSMDSGLKADLTENMDPVRCNIPRRRWDFRASLLRDSLSATGLTA
eukprot:TRINITY_DN84244_c0_g1_i1.p1 TRINITY_DN84244_c0_g1~~TRINITY_DN84244_c0_g1_i1.p1  ORF type:complete len:559 (-),score=92.48 TRINITY_DN84244_c0_g1_i1:222-1898(-)